jgi:hypothetical protein
MRWVKLTSKGAPVWVNLDQCVEMQVFPYMMSDGRFTRLTTTAQDLSVSVDVEVQETPEEILALAMKGVT